MLDMIVQYAAKFDNYILGIDMLTIPFRNARCSSLLTVLAVSWLLRYISSRFDLLDLLYPPAADGQGNRPCSSRFSK